MTSGCTILLLLLSPSFFFPPKYFVVFLEDGDLNLKKPILLQKQQQLKSAFA